MNRVSDRDQLLVTSKADAAYRQLRSSILDASLAPGSRLDHEGLATRLGFSITPVREAVRRLEVERLVLRSAHKEVLIAPLSLTELRQLYAIRLELDPLAVAGAAQQAGAEQLKRAADILARQNPRTAREQLERNRAFHRLIYSACGNDALVELLDTLWDRTDRYRFVLVRQRRHAVAADLEHQGLLEAVLAHDRKRAAALMREHLAESCEAIATELTALGDPALLAAEPPKAVAAR